jgi:hypothetical protein
MKLNVAHLAAWIFLGGLTSISFGQIFPNSSGNAMGSGNTKYRQIPGSSVFRDKTISDNYYRSPGNPGTVHHNVNLFSGTPEYHVPLGELTQGDAIKHPIEIFYSGMARQSYDENNGTAPTSWIGYGWDMAVPFVAINHKGTVPYVDDAFYCDLGKYGQGQLLQNNEGKFFVTGNPTIQVDKVMGEDGSIKQWIFRTPAGVRLIFGSSKPGDGADRYLNQVPYGYVPGTTIATASTISANPHSVATGFPFVYRWDISRMEEFGNGVFPYANALEFRHQPVNVPLPGGKSFTRESYLKEIIRKDQTGGEVERYLFTVAEKTAAETFSESFEPLLTQHLQETRYLSRIDRFFEGQATPEKSLLFISHVEAPSGPDFPYAKRVLDRIETEFPNTRGGVINDDRQRWKFEYDMAANRHMGLKTIFKPYQGKDEYEYGRPNFQDFPAWTNRTRQEAKRTLRKEKTGVPDGEDVIPSQFPELMSNHTYCNERFCFIAVSDETDGVPVHETLHLEVWKNNGNFFELARTNDGKVLRRTFTSNFDKSFQVIPWNEDFLVVDARGKKLYLYEWQGESFKLITNFIQREYTPGVLTPVTFTTSSAEYSRLNIQTGSDFFVVQDAGRNTDALFGSKFYVIQKVAGRWKDLNEQEPLPGPCVVETPDVKYVDYRHGHFDGNHCMEFFYNSQFLTVTKNGFIIVESRFNILMPFVRNAEGTSFLDISSRIAGGIPGQVTDDPERRMVWKLEYPIRTPVFAGEDYMVFICGSTLNVLAFDGHDIRGVTSMGSAPNLGLYDEKTVIVAEKDYFIAVRRANNPEFWYRKATFESGVPNGLTFERIYLRPIGDNLPEGNIRVATHPNALSVEVYSKDLPSPWDPRTATPLQDVANKSYHSYLYKVDPNVSRGGYTPVRVPLSEFSNGAAQPSHLFGVTFSSTDNILTAKGCVTTTGGLCQGGLTTDKITFFSARMTPGLPSASYFLRDLKPTHDAWAGANPNYYPRNFVMSAAARIGAVTLLNLTTNRFEFQLLQSMGTGFMNLPFEKVLPYPPSPTTNKLQGDLNFVKSFTEYSDIAGPDWNKGTRYEYQYLPMESSFLTKDPEYNAHQQRFVFPGVNILTKRLTEGNGNPMPEGAATHSYLLDESSDPIPEPYLAQSGLPSQTEFHDMNAVQGVPSNGRLIKSHLYEYHLPQWELSWPDKLYVFRLKRETEMEYALNGSSRRKVTTLLKYHPGNNLPLFAKTKLDDKWYLSQTLVHPHSPNNTMPFGKATFRLDSEPSDLTLKDWPNTGTWYDVDGAGFKAIASELLEYDPLFPYMTWKKWNWKFKDGSITAADKKRGVDPIQEVWSGYRESEHIVRRNLKGQPLEVTVSTDQGGYAPRRQIHFYEGLGSLRAGTIDNAYYEDVAILTCENGRVAGLTHSYDWEGRWKIPPRSGPFGIYPPPFHVDVQAHSGRFSLLTGNTEGVTTDLKLKGVGAQGYDYLISVWIYAYPTTAANKKPTIAVERYKGNGTLIDALPAVSDPVGAPFESEKWQLYEFRITNEQLRLGSTPSQPLFTDPEAGDFIRVSIGAPDGGLTAPKSILVDDIVCRPATAIYSLSTYDFRGNVISATDNDNVTKFFEYDVFGVRTATRDDKHLIFNLTSSHLPGEND